MISIITATHQRPDLLYRCIRAVQQQTVQDYEHIIVADRCKKAKQVVDFVNDPRISYYETPDDRPDNHGGPAKNIGIANAKFDYICYCDDDNLLLENAVEVFARGLRHYDLVRARYYSIAQKEGDGSIKQVLERPFKCTKASHGAGCNDMLVYAHTKDLIRRVGGWTAGWDGKQAEDDVLIPKLMRWGILNSVSDIVAIYYARLGCKVPDKEYQELYDNLGDSLFCYPELANI